MQNAAPLDKSNTSVDFYETVIIKKNFQMTILITKNSANEMSDCQQYFERALAKGKKNNFRIPTWMKTS